MIRRVSRSVFTNDHRCPPPRLRASRHAAPSRIRNHSSRARRGWSAAERRGDPVVDRGEVLLCVKRLVQIVWRTGKDERVHRRNVGTRRGRSSSISASGELQSEPPSRVPATWTVVSSKGARRSPTTPAPPPVTEGTASKFSLQTKLASSPTTSSVGTRTSSGRIALCDPVAA